MGGEHVSKSPRPSWARGSSPRGRGTPLPCTSRAFGSRIIPAWAGNTLSKFICFVAVSDHPRVGGEHGRLYSPSWRQFGSSPRGRGTPSAWERCPTFIRIIPAWAGNTPTPPAMSVTASDHPRVGGEHHCDTGWHHHQVGSSPRGRGTQSGDPSQQSRDRIIPAWAGNTCSVVSEKSHRPDHPRVGGEHASDISGRARAFGSSPRGRGTRPMERPNPRWLRIIPAWAGNTLASLWGSNSDADHPRVGGEHGIGNALNGPPTGSSPRGRGTRQGSKTNLALSRIIPAWAGNTVGQTQTIM